MKTETTEYEDYVSLYRQAFREHGCRALWNIRELENPRPEDALAITRSLRVEGDLSARRLAEQIEKAWPRPPVNCRGVFYACWQLSVIRKVMWQEARPFSLPTGRFSDDIGIQDREERVARAAREDSDILQAEGLEVIWLRREPAIYTAEVRHKEERTRLEWVVDSDFRFFPTVKDDLFGYILHPIDLATNKVMAAAGRQRPADLVDLLAIHENIRSLGPVIWRRWRKPPALHRRD